MTTIRFAGEILLLAVTMTIIWSVFAVVLP